MKKKLGVFQSGVLTERFPVGEIRETQLNEITPEAKERFPFYFCLPYDDPVALFAWRVYCRHRCIRDLKFRAAVWEMCRRDVAFFAVTFLFIFEPRPVPRRLPFHLWTDQVTLMAWDEEVFGRRSSITNKTRGIGESWRRSAFLFHKWYFLNESKIAVLTKDKDLLDGPDANSLLGKFQYFFDNMPEWAKYTKSGGSVLVRLAKTNSFVNVQTKAVIQGFVSTSAKLRQLRFTVIWPDEYAFYERTDQEEWLVSAGGCTNSIMITSTWNDFDDAFNRLMFEEVSSMLRINAFWWNNHERWQGAYKMQGGRVIFIDQDYKHPEGYEFGMPDVIDDGTIRSPWVDAEMSKPGINRLKALRDIYGSSVCEQTNSFFSSEARQVVRLNIIEPDKLGTMTIQDNKVEIIPTLKGDLRIWGGVPKNDRGPYVSFADLGQGVGQAHSVWQVLDRGGEQVLQYGTNRVDIGKFAENVAALARWLAGDHGDGWVLIDYEVQGQQGRPFASTLLRLNYCNIHKSERRSNTVRRVGEVPTYYGTCNKDAGNTNFKEMDGAILRLDCLPHSEQVADDMRRCGKDEDGRPKFGITKDGHGDYCYALAGAWWRAKTLVSLENRAEIEGSKKQDEREHFAESLQSAGSLWSDDWQ